VRILSNVALLVLCVSCATANTVIEIRSYLPSSPNPCFTVLKNRKRVSGIAVKLYQQNRRGESPYWASLTNKDGIACPSELPEGKYEIYVISGRRSGELDIDVAKNNDVGGFQIALLLPDQLRSAAAVPVTTWVREFKGVVEDATGGVIPKVKIEILRKDPAGEIDENSMAKIESNDRGRFSLGLQAGAYVAIFEYPGFNLTAFPFEINQKGWSGIRVTLQVGDANRTPPHIAELNTDK
jgi:hypothetical protein